MGAGWFPANDKDTKCNANANDTAPRPCIHRNRNQSFPATRLARHMHCGRTAAHLKLHELGAAHNDDLAQNNDGVSDDTAPGQTRFRLALLNRIANCFVCDMVFVVTVVACSGDVVALGGPASRPNWKIS